MEDESGDLNNFGYREIEEAKKLLDAFAYNNNTKLLGTWVTLHFNANSGNVYLLDDDYNSALVTADGILEDWFICNECDCEGFLEDMLTYGLKCCKQMLIDLEVIEEEEEEENK